MFSTAILSNFEASLLIYATLQIQQSVEESTTEYRLRNEMGHHGDGIKRENISERKNAN